MPTQTKLNPEIKNMVEAAYADSGFLLACRIGEAQFARGEVVEVPRGYVKTLRTA